MNADQILKLIDAGYTKSEINDLIQGGEAEKPEETKEAEEPEKNDSAPEKMELEKKEPEKPEQTPDILKFIADEFAKMTKSIQDSNILNSNMKMKEDVSVEQMLADLVNPDGSRRKEQSK